MKTLLLLAASVAFLSSSAWAETKLTIRGGYADSGSDYPYAFDGVDQSLIESGYGNGFFGYIGLSDSSMFGTVAGEVSLTYHRLTDSDSYDDGGRCSTFDVISVSHAFCMNGAETSNTTSFSQFRLMAKRQFPSNGLELLGGIGVLDFSSDSSGMMFFPGEFSQQNRSNDYTGLGVVFGARRDFAIYGASTLQLEGFAGAYFGQRDLEINDNWVGNVGDLSRRDNQVVYSLDLSASVATPFEAITSGGVFEFGVTYSRVFNVMDTTNYNTTTAPFVGQTGSLDDDVDAFSIFLGLQVPL